jgi:regulator of sigma E protease
MGPPIFRIPKKDTEYRISLIPLGGYVKMAGESFGESLTGAEYEFQSKSCWQRFQVFVAGAVMNILLAFPLTMFAFLYGKYESEPIIGMPARAEYRAGIGPGDRILEVDGVRISSLEGYIREVVKKPKGAIMKVKVDRNGKTREFDVVHNRAEFHRNFPAGNVIGDIAIGSIAQYSGLLKNDLIVSIDDKPIYGVIDITSAIKNSQGKPLCLTVRRDKEFVKVLVTPKPRKVYEFPEDTRLLEPIVGNVLEGYPAYGVLFSGDIIKKINGEEITSWSDVREKIKRLAGLRVQLEIVRGNRDKTVYIDSGCDYNNEGFLGIEVKETKIVADVPEDSFYFGILQQGDVIKSIDGNIGDVFVKDIFLKVPSGVSDIVKAKVKRNDKEIEIKINPEEHIYGEPIGIVLQTQMRFNREDIVNAIILGIKEPIDLGILTLSFLYKLVVREESTKNIAGPVGVFQVSIMGIKLGTGNFIWLLALITISLGIFNLLPIPALDGGYILLLVIEKIKGRPLSSKFVATFQYVGFVLLISLIVYVTYTDIHGLIFGR